MSTADAGALPSPAGAAGEAGPPVEDAYVGGLSGLRTVANTTGMDFVEPRVPVRNWTAPPIEGGATCSFNVGAFKRLLREHPVRCFRQWVLSGLQHGFDNGSEVEERLVEQLPHQSAREDMPAVRKWLLAEEERGHVQSFTKRPHPFTRACPVGLVPKGEKKRFISDLSAGDDSVNASVCKAEYGIRMIRFQDVVDIAAEFGPDCHATFIDVRSAYRNVPLHPSNWHLQVYLCDGVWWVDKRISFGSTSSAFVFDRVACAIEWIAQRAIDAAVGAGNCRLVHYLDDFALLARTKRLCEAASKALLATFKELGVPMAADKTKIATQEAEYLGMRLDIRRQVVALPQDKKYKLRARLANIVDLAAPRPRARDVAAVQLPGTEPDAERRGPDTQRRAAGLGSLRKQAAEQLVGQLTWAHVTMPHHRTHINPLLAHVMRLQTRASSTRLQRHAFTGSVTRELVDAAKVWLAALDTAPPRPFSTRPSVLHSTGLWLGREHAMPRWVRRSEATTCTAGDHAVVDGGPDWVCVSAPASATWNWWGDTNGEAWAVGDAAGELGLGWFNHIRAVHRPWTASERASFTLGTEQLSKNSSTLQELKCLTHAVEAWVRLAPAHGAIFNFFTDAQNLGHVLAKGRSGKRPINLELRRLHAMCVDKALHVRAHWHPRACWAGVLADMLSRGGMQEFREASSGLGHRRGQTHPCLP